MKITMLTSTPGALNGGLDVVLFKKGHVYDTKDMEGIGEIFLDNDLAEAHAEEYKPEKMIEDAPENKGVSTDAVDSDDEKKDEYTADLFDGMKAKEIRSFALDEKIDLSDQPANTSAKKLVDVFLKRKNG